MAVFVSLTHAFSDVRVDDTVRIRPRPRRSVPRGSRRRRPVRVRDGAAPRGRRDLRFVDSKQAREAHLLRARHRRGGYASDQSPAPRARHTRRPALPSAPGSARAGERAAPFASIVASKADVLGAKTRRNPLRWRFSRPARAVCDISEGPSRTRARAGSRRLAVHRQSPRRAPRDR